MSAFLAAIPRGLKTLILLACFSSVSFYMGGAYFVHKERIKAKIETAEQTAKMYEKRKQTNEKIDRSSISDFCGSVLGLQYADRQECVRRLGKAYP